MEVSWGMGAFWIAVIFVAENPLVARSVQLILETGIDDLQPRASVGSVNCHPHSHVQESAIPEHQWGYKAGLAA